MGSKDEGQKIERSTLNVQRPMKRRIQGVEESRIQVKNKGKGERLNVQAHNPNLLTFIF